VDPGRRERPSGGIHRRAEEPSRGTAPRAEEPSRGTHYDSEPRRRPLFTSLIAAGGLPAGLACDDGGAVHFTDEALAEVVSDRLGARGYRVEPDGTGGARQTPLPPRLLPGTTADLPARRRPEAGRRPGG